MKKCAVWIAAGWTSVFATLPGVTACGGEDDKASSHGAGAGGTTSAAGTGGGAGKGAVSGGASGSNAAGGSSGSAASVGGAMSSGGAGGSASGTGGRGGAGTTGGSAGTTGGSASGAAGMATGGAAGSTGGSAGSGGTAGTGPLGSATFTVEKELASDVDASAPGTVGIVTWTIDKTALTSASIEFGLDTTYGTSAPVDLALTDHRTLLLGMKPSKTYHFRVVAADAASTYQSEDFTLETGPATTLIPLDKFEITDAAKHERGFIISSFWSGAANGMTFIVDADGDIVWWYADGPNSIARARLSADAKNMWMISADNQGAPLQRVSLDTLDGQTYSNVVGSHDITAVSGDKMAFLEYGESDCNSIFELDPSGTKTEVFESQGVVTGSGCHGNALRYDQAEDMYTFSDVSTDIFGVSRGGDVLWKLSEIVPTGNDAWKGTQHGHQLLASSILVFANVGVSKTESAAIEYDLETGAELSNISSGDFSQNLGDVQRLPGGNTLVTFSNDSVIKEFDAQKNVVLEINGGGSRFGYALWTDSLYGPPADIAQ